MAVNAYLIWIDFHLDYHYPIIRWTFGNYFTCTRRWYIRLLWRYHWSWWDQWRQSWHASHLVNTPTTPWVCTHQRTFGCWRHTIRKARGKKQVTNESIVFWHLSERVHFVLTCISLLLPQPVSIFEMIRMVATARIVMPKSMVRLSAGRVRFSQSEQAMCFLAGANSIFTGDKLLTTPNNEFTDDQKMFELLGKFLPCLKSPF